MGSITIASIVFVCVFSSALLGMFLRATLPRHHLSEDSKDVVKLAMGLIVTMAALVLGLLTASANSTFDTQNAEVQLISAKVVQLDRVLACYGPETKEIRDRLRRIVAFRTQLTWPEDFTTPVKMGTSGATLPGERIDAALINLAPQTDAQREFKSRALQIMHDLMGMRWLLFAQMNNPIPILFLVVLAFWLGILFVSFGLFAPPNTTVVSALLVSALAVSVAIFLILEMNQPFEGWVKIPSTPLHDALSQLGR